ncbi:UNVERIFIED_ORG: ABC-type nitrate/sulfonate/bicarbonate transport system ATPase subunit [Pseudomonas vranovensis]|nr:ABC-type nitrate/sulfonate/bicarbonate transport system ATPase subunit [Pseudomonas vranovensis]
MRWQGLMTTLLKKVFCRFHPLVPSCFRILGYCPGRAYWPTSFWGIEGESAEQQGRKALASVGLAGRESAWPNQLSGGEQQRAALARSLVRRPQLLLADEPFGALDALTRLKMQALLRSVVQRERPTVLLVTHDVDEALALADRILVLDQGRIMLDVPVELASRSAELPAFTRLRQRLLRSLGVDDSLTLVAHP